MGGVATDYGSFMKVLMNSKELRDLMLIPIAEQKNTLMIDKYFCEGVTQGIITTAPICRVVISSNPQSPTNNPYVKEDMLAIEVFVPNAIGTSNLDRKNISGFERRSNQIVDRIIKLFHNKKINDRKMMLEARHELTCSTVGFCRHIIQFSYKRVYS
ncbi:hypothetical protein G9F71_008275 [Clostridium sp. FP2]|uniref:hypothetical protein n=1 Tax=Clostridium sp. FP2 TaxID=2724481 RepID=UPI0013E95252|nr:hypothetical protein [Clostridium sp. FP2]MBZ9622847.1 hypothetical protein [Clostridium sp. FP2]